MVDRIMIDRIMIDRNKDRPDQGSRQAATLSVIRRWRSDYLIAC